MRLVREQVSLALLQGIVLISLVTFTSIIVISLMTMMVGQSVLARGGIGYRGVAGAALKMLLVCSQALGAAVFISCVLCVFELCAVAFYPSINAWLSFCLPMLSTLFLVAATGFSLIKREEQLRLQIALSEGCYRMLFEKSLVGAYKATLDGRILDCNFSFCQIFGYASREEVIRNSVNIGYFNATDRDRFTTWLRAEEHLTNFEQCLRRKDGGTAWVLNSATLARGEAGKEPVIKGTMMDISEFGMELPAWLRKMARILVAVRWSFTTASQH